MDNLGMAEGNRIDNCALLPNLGKIGLANTHRFWSDALAPQVSKLHIKPLRHAELNKSMTSIE